MGKNLVFNLSGALYDAEPVKIERKDLYGSDKIIAYDECGQECETASLDEGGAGLIPKGGLGLGILSPEGLWVERSMLKAVDENGNDAPLIQSNYDCTTMLRQKTEADDFLDYCITAFYVLDNCNLGQVLGKDIYMFDYCYRASYEPSSAFILASEGIAYMLVGYKAQFEMLSLSEETCLDEDEDEQDEDIDFSMI
jgi:hypothetical protein